MIEDSCTVYEIANQLDGMKYFGVTKNPHKRFIFHCAKSTRRSYLAHAIAKHGKENFQMKVLLVSNRRYCLEMEAKLIKAYNTVAPNGYNICGGGEGPVASLAGNKNPMFGRKQKPESVAKSRAGVLGAKNYLAKRFIATSPDGVVHSGISLSLFCTEHKLHIGNMSSVARGARNHSQGWKVQYV